MNKHKASVTLANQNPNITRRTEEIFASCLKDLLTQHFSTLEAERKLI